MVVQAVEGAIKEEGWRMVMLLRLSPILPFTPLNYALSVTPISSWAYTWASALGIIPGMAYHAVVPVLPADCDVPRCTAAYDVSAGSAGWSFQKRWLRGLLAFPGTLLYVYLGSLANDLGELLSGRRKVSPVITIISAVLSGVLIVATFVIVSVRARRAISRCACPMSLMSFVLAPAFCFGLKYGQWVHARH